MSVAEIITRGFLGAPAGIREVITGGYIHALLPPHHPDFGGGGMIPGQLEMIFTFEMFKRMMTKLGTDLWLADAQVKLFQNDIVVDAETILADFVEADYTGYAPIALSGSPTIFLGASQNFCAVYPHKTFQPTGTVIPNDVYGYWVESLVLGTGVVLCWAARFPEPFALTGPEDAIIVEPRFIVGQPTIE